MNSALGGPGTLEIVRLKRPGWTARSTGARSALGSRPKPPISVCAPCGRALSLNRAV